MSVSKISSLKRNYPLEEKLFKKKPKVYDAYRSSIASLSYLEIKPTQTIRGKVRKVFREFISTLDVLIKELSSFLHKKKKKHSFTEKPQVILPKSLPKAPTKSVISLASTSSSIIPDTLNKQTDRVFTQCKISLDIIEKDLHQLMLKINNQKKILNDFDPSIELSNDFLDAVCKSPFAKYEVKQAINAYKFFIESNDSTNFTNDKEYIFKGELRAKKNNLISLISDLILELFSLNESIEWPASTWDEYRIFLENIIHKSKESKLAIHYALFFNLLKKTQKFSTHINDIHQKFKLELNKNNSENTEDNIRCTPQQWNKLKQIVLKTDEISLEFINSIKEIQKPYKKERINLSALVETNAAIQNIYKETFEEIKYYPFNLNNALNETHKNIKNVTKKNEKYKNELKNQSKELENLVNQKTSDTGSPLFKPFNKLVQRITHIGSPRLEGQSDQLLVQFENFRSTFRNDKNLQNDASLNKLFQEADKTYKNLLDAIKELQELELTVSFLETEMKNVQKNRISSQTHIHFRYLTISNFLSFLESTLEYTSEACILTSELIRSQKLFRTEFNEVTNLFQSLKN